MGKIEILISAVLEIIETVSFCYVVLKKRRQKVSWKKGAGLAVAVIVFFILWLQGYGYYPVLLIVFEAVIFFLINFLYGMNLAETLRIWFFIFSFLSIVETVFENLLNFVVEQRSPFSNVLLCSIVVILFLWLYHILIGKKIDGEKFQLPVRLWVLTEGILFVYMLMVTYFSYLLKFIRPARLVLIGAVLSVLGGVGTFGIILAVMYYFNGTAKYKIQSEMAESYNAQQREYFIKLLEREEETKKFRHDILGHFLRIQGLCKEEDLEIKKYISELLKSTGELSDKQFDVGNEIVNVMINYYFAPLRDTCDISVKGYAGKFPAVSDVDLCVVISNLVKNAAEAASSVAKGRGAIRFFISEGNQYLNIRVENTYEGNIVFGKEGMPKTGKGTGGHGFGVWNVKEAVEKYQGRLKIKAENNWYTAEVFMKIS